MEQKTVKIKSKIKGINMWILLFRQFQLLSSDILYSRIKIYSNTKKGILKSLKEVAHYDRL